MKKYFYLLLMTIFIFPFCVKAYTVEEANEFFNSLDDEITIQGVNPESLNYMTEENQWFYRSAVLKFHLLKNPNELLEKILNFEDDLEYEVIDNGNTLKVKTWCSGNNGGEVSKNISLKYVDLNENEFSKAKQITDNLDYYYSLGGMNSINSLYHYGYISEEASDSIARFPELKKIVEMYSEYDVEILLDRGGGTPNWEERYAYVGFYKDNVLYSFKEILLHIDEVIFVDKDKEGTFAKRAENRLNDYFKGDVNIVVDENVTDWMDEHDDFELFKKDYKDINVYNIVSTNITIGDKQFYMMIVETDSNGIDKMYVESFDKNTGINIQTESYDVPIDSIVKVKDASNEDYVKKAVEDNNMKIIKVYDIDLMKYSDKKLVKEIKNGLEIFIPIENATEGEDITIYYINSDGEIKEDIDGKIVKQNDKLFAKFTTNHLSTYAILEKEETSNNPDTGDSGDKPELQKKEYVLTDENAEVKLEFDEGHEFELKFKDITKFTDEQLSAFGMTRTDFNEILDTIKNNTKANGTLIGVFMIEVNEGDVGYTNSVNVKFKLTDEIKKYKSFKFIYLDDENNFKAVDVVDFTVDGDYIVGTLPHLSAYALVGSEETTPANQTKNPQTGDNIITYVTMFAVSVLSLTTTVIVYKKKIFN